MKEQFYLVGDGTQWFTGGWNNPSSPIMSMDINKACKYVDSESARDAINRNDWGYCYEVYKYKLTIRREYD